MLKTVTICCSEQPKLQDLCFKKVAGMPLLLRNILTLRQLGMAKIRVAIPEKEKHRFYKKLPGYLRKWGAEVEWIPYSEGNSPTEAIWGHALILEESGTAKTAMILTEKKDLKKATRLITEMIRKAALGPIARTLNKRISLPISLWLMRFKLHANWITLFNMGLGLLAGITVSGGTYRDYLLGGILFQIVSIVDGCDGEVARLSFKSSKFGELIDSVSDSGSLICFVVGLLVANFRLHGTDHTVLLSSLLALGLGGIFWQVISYLRKNTGSASLATFDKEYLQKLPFPKDSFLLRWINFWKIVVRKDGFSFAFFLLAICGLLPFLIHICIVVTFGTNITLLYVKQKLALLAEDEKTSG